MGQVVPDWLESQEDGSNCSSNHQLSTDNAINLPQKSYKINRQQLATTAHGGMA